MDTERQQILDWSAQGHILPEDIDAALAQCNSQPTQQHWLLFVKRLLLWLGITSLAASVIFFFAFNWQSISTFTKFASLQTLLVTTALYTTRPPSLSPLSTAITCFLALITGALFALSGQIYQTGADPWQLFAIWALFVTPWALLSRSSTLWLLWLMLINLAFALYTQTFRGLLGFLFKEEELIGLLLLINTTSLCALEFAYFRKQPWLSNRVASQVALILSGFLATWLAIWSIFDYSDVAWGSLCYMIWMAAVIYFYRYKHMDLLALSGCATSLIVVFSSLMINTLAGGFDGGALLFISLSIIGMSTTAGIWLKKLTRLTPAPSLRDKQPTTGDS